MFVNFSTVFFCLGLSAVIVHAESAIADADALAITGVAILAVSLWFLLISISRQPVSKMVLSFKVILITEDSVFHHSELYNYSNIL